MFIICSYNTGPYVEKGKTGGVKSENIKSLHINNMKTLVYLLSKI